jgi:hypothetical protein
MTHIFGFSTNAALRYITDKLKVKIGERYYYQIRRKILEESETIIQYYSDNNNFIHLEQFINRITETELMRIKAWQLFNENSDNPKLQLEIMDRLHSYTQSLLELYGALPQIINYHSQNNRIGNTNTNVNRNLTNRSIPFEGMEAEAERIERERLYAAEHSGEAKF